MSYARISGTGSYLPERVLTNFDLEQMVDTSDEWIYSRTGIRERHIVGDRELTSDLATQAARQALSAASLEPEQIDLILVATTTPDRIFPSTACTVQQKLAIGNGGAAFDVQAVCSGFIYALATANNFIRAGQAQRALVIGAETMSRVTDWSDRTNCILWGDGAGAVVLEQSAAPGVISTHLHSDGSYSELLRIQGGVSAGFDSACTIEMEGNAVFKIAVNTLDSIVDETLAANGMQKSDVDWLVPHQANIRIIQATAKKLGMSMDRVVATIEKHGNTSAASIPLALDYAVREGKIKNGETILMEAFGGGFTWGSALLRWQS